MITIDVLCVNKNGRLENGKVITDLSFQPTNSPNLTHSTGAKIGLPDPNNLHKEEEVGYNVISGVITVSVKDQAEADKYVLGTEYQIAIGGKPQAKPAKKLTTSPATSNVKIDKVEQ